MESLIRCMHCVTAFEVNSGWEGKRTFILQSASHANWRIAIDDMDSPNSITVSWKSEMTEAVLWTGVWVVWA